MGGYSRWKQLWVGTSAGAVLFQSATENASLLATFGDRPVRAIAEDEDGTMWIALLGAHWNMSTRTNLCKKSAPQTGYPRKN